MEEILEKLEIFYNYQISYLLFINLRVTIKLVILKQNLLNLFPLCILVIRKELQR